MGALKRPLQLAEVDNASGSSRHGDQFLSFVRGKVEIKLPSEVRHLNAVTTFLSQHAVGFGIIQEDDTRLSLALGEAIANAIKHGNQSDPAKWVYIIAEYSQDEARFAIRDEGEGFDPASVPDPRFDENRFKSSGRGILLMRHMMDEVIYSEIGNEVIMIKRPELV